MKYVFNALILIVVILVIRQAACVKSENADPVFSTEISSEKVGSTKTVKKKTELKNPTSIAFDNENGNFYVSALGKIYSLGISSQITDTLKISELYCPKNLTVKNGILYFTDSVFLKAYSFSEDSLVKNIKISSDAVLSDVKTDNKGTVYVSSASDGCIFKLAGDSAVIFSKDTILKNGCFLCPDGGDFFVVTKNKLLSADKRGKLKFISQLPFESRKIKTDLQGNFLIISSSGFVYAFSREKKFEKIVTEINAVDFEYVGKQNMLPVVCNDGVYFYEPSGYLKKTLLNKE